MRVKSLTAVALLMALVATTAQAAPVFYLSDTDSPSGPGVLNMDLTPGATGSLFVFATTDVRLSGISLDVENMGAADAITFTDFEVANPNSRWTFLDGPPVAEQARVRSLGGGAIPGVAGNGIGPDSPEAPAGPQGYMLGHIDYTAGADGSGTANLFLKVGNNTIADWDGGNPEVFFGDMSHGGTNGGTVGATDSMADAILSVGGVLEGPLYDLVGDPNFGTVFRTAVQERMFTISNMGTEDLVLGTPTVSGAGGYFELVDAASFPTTIAAGGEGEFSVRMSAPFVEDDTTIGGLIEFSTNVSGLETAQVVLEATVVVPEPGSIALAGLAVFGLVGVAVRRRK